jgi:hypothetical protein
MKSIRLSVPITVLVLLLMTTCGFAAEHESEVVIEISADNMTADKVEKNIADPIELLMSNLQDVLLISAKYSNNEAEITVKFDPEATKRSDLVERVRRALDKMTTMPDSIISLSVSLAGDMPEVAEVETKIRPAQARSFEGSYLGNIQSSNEFVPIVTDFTKPDGSFGRLSSGKYQMSEAKSVVTGQISSCLFKENYLMVCRWKDKYGQGSVSFQFTDDYERFKASWKIDRVKGEFKWNGAKIKAIPE